MQRERLNNEGRRAQVEGNLRQVRKVNRPSHDKCVPEQSTFRVKLDAPTDGCMHWVSQGHDRMAVGAKLETKRQGRMVSLSRQRDGIMVHGL